MYISISFGLNRDAIGVVLHRRQVPFAKFAANEHLALAVTERGGHLGWCDRADSRTSR
jgi:predicted alpha/beta-fold hydrolase